MRVKSESLEWLPSLKALIDEKFPGVYEEVVWKDGRRMVWRGDGETLEIEIRVL